MSATSQRPTCSRHPGGYFGSGCPRCGRRDLAWERAHRGWRPRSEDATPSTLHEAAPASKYQTDLVSPQDSSRQGQGELFD